MLKEEDVFYIEIKDSIELNKCKLILNYYKSLPCMLSDYKFPYYLFVFSKLYTDRVRIIRKDVPIYSTEEFVNKY